MNEWMKWITVQFYFRGQVSENSESPARTFFITSDIGNRYLCCVTIIDLDPKSFNKIPAYIEEEKNVVGYFLESSQAALCNALKFKTVMYNYVTRFSA